MNSQKFQMLKTSTSSVSLEDSLIWALYPLSCQNENDPQKNHQPKCLPTRSSLSSKEDVSRKGSSSFGYHKAAGGGLLKKTAERMGRTEAEMESRKNQKDRSQVNGYEKIRLERKVSEAYLKLHELKQSFKLRKFQKSIILTSSRLYGVS